jgi:hypothetical protein
MQLQQHTVQQSRFTPCPTLHADVRCQHEEWSPLFPYTCTHTHAIHSSSDSSCVVGTLCLVRIPWTRLHTKVPNCCPFPSLVLPVCAVVALLCMLPIDVGPLHHHQGT